MVASTTASAAGLVAPSAAPDPEVRAVAKRRRFTAAYKLSVLEEADRDSTSGAIGALLRRRAVVERGYEACGRVGEPPGFDAIAVGH